MGEFVLVTRVWGRLSVWKRSLDTFDYATWFVVWSGLFGLVRGYGRGNSGMDFVVNPLALALSLKGRGDSVWSAKLCERNLEAAATS